MWMDMRSLLGFGLMAIVFVSACVAPAPEVVAPAAPTGPVSQGEVNDLLNSTNQIEEQGTFDIGGLEDFDISIP